jgi:hypothetical protein
MRENFFSCVTVITYEYKMACSCSLKSDFYVYRRRNATKIVLVFFSSIRITRSELHKVARSLVIAFF